MKPFARVDASVRRRAFGNCCFVTGCDLLCNHEMRLKKTKEDEERGVVLFCCCLFFLRYSYSNLYKTFVDVSTLWLFKRAVGF